jgi:acetoacetyl-CoA synthetase
MKKPLWVPSEERKRNSNLASFIKFAQSSFNSGINDYDSLYNWSINDIPNFWKAIWEFGRFKHSEAYSQILSNDEMMNAQWFRGAKLNFAENLLKYRDSNTALISVRENETAIKLSSNELYKKVAQCSQFLRDIGVQKGDRVAAIISNIPEAVIGMLAAASIGAIWTSCSPDFGIQGILDRFGQIKPKVLLAVDSYSYNGRIIDCAEKVMQLSKAIPEIENIILVTSMESKDFNNHCNLLYFNEIKEYTSSSIDFEQVAFDHPLFIMYSSGTTGKPKCIVHGTGRVLLQHFKELYLHTNLKREDTITFFTTCGWMMWNWLVSSLQVGASILLYDGSPVYPKVSTLWDLIDEHSITVFGASPKYLSICQEHKYFPMDSNRLDTLKTILSTGSPLTGENYNFVYGKVKQDVLLSSISGGTDIISCFMLGNPLLPVYSEEIQCKGLGMKIKVFDKEGKSLVNQKGELVCTAPFPSMPIYFWNDENGLKYKSAYFDYYPGIWRHGDFILINDRGGIVVFGRSDATLNPGGVRIGSSEIYNIVEEMEEIVDSLVIGQPWKDDVRIILFIVLKDNILFNNDLKEKIKQKIKKGTSPRHVPAKIIKINEVPRTMNMKKIEMAVLKTIRGEKIDNREALANPESLNQFVDLKELEEE